jgi:hypothetical protein
MGADKPKIRCHQHLSMLSRLQLYGRNISHSIMEYTTRYGGLAVIACFRQRNVGRTH